jgi:protein gp37
MSENTKIEWATHTFNPWEGCQKVGPGCDNCYAENRNARFGGGAAVNWGPGAPRRRTSIANWRKPLAWNAAHEEFFAANGHRQRVFCASLADVFDNAVEPQWRDDLYSLIRATPNLDWLLLTKRIGNVSGWGLPVGNDGKTVLPNIWIGATIVNQEEADRDIPKLLAVPAAKRFLSMEPLLGPVDLSYWIEPTVHCGACMAHYPPAEALPDPNGHKMGADKCAACGTENCMGTWWGHEAIEEASRPDGVELDQWDSGYRLNWVIVGGESGPNARPMHPDWARSLRDQCEAAGVPFLFKQWGEWVPRGPESMGYPCVENVARVRLTDAGHNGSVLGAKGGNDVWMQRAGKKAAGRLLDGSEHNGFPD